MKSRLAFSAFLVSTFCAGLTVGLAQQPTPSQESFVTPTPSQPRIADWTDVAHVFDHWRGKLYVVTVDHPGHRFNCQFQSIDANALTCAAAGLRSARTFSRDKIAALISPGYHERIWLPFFGVIAAGDGIIAAGYFLASIAFPAAILLYVVGGLVVLSSGAIAIGSGNSDTSDTVLYQRPSTPLTVKLR